MNHFSECKANPAERRRSLLRTLSTSSSFLLCHAFGVFRLFSPTIWIVNNSRRSLTSPSLLSWLGRTWQKTHWCVLEPFSRHGRRKCVHGKLVKPFTVLPQRTSSFKHSVRCSRLRLSGQIIWQLSDAVGGARFRTENWRRPRPGVATQCGARGPR